MFVSFLLFSFLIPVWLGWRVTKWCKARVIGGDVADGGQLLELQERQFDLRRVVHAGGRGTVPRVPPEGGDQVVAVGGRTGLRWLRHSGLGGRKGRGERSGARGRAGARRGGDGWKRGGCGFSIVEFESERLS